ncbi:MAG: 2-dehydropantoate 2-reductase [Chloroflexota bacterium]
MHFAVIGSGSVGCLYGATLAHYSGADVQVTMIDIDQAHVDAMQANGLRFEQENDEFVANVTATTDPSNVVPVDVALICVNGYSTREAAQSAKTILKDDGYAITLQNGLGNVEVLVDALGKERVLGGITYHSAVVVGPGHARHGIVGKTPIGELDGITSPRVTVLAGRMAKAGLSPVIDDNIMSVIWGKFVHNCSLNAICGITQLRPGHISEVPELDEFQDMIIEETMALVRAKGITLPEPDPRPAIKAFCAIRFHLVSLTQHLMAGKPTEIDSLNGYVVEESKKLGLAAPYNDALTRLIKGRQHIPANELGPASA